MNEVPGSIVSAVEALASARTQREWERLARVLYDTVSAGVPYTQQVAEEILRLVADRLDGDEGSGEFFAVYGDPTKRDNTAYREWLHDGWDAVTERHRDVVDMYRGWLVLNKVTQLVSPSIPS